MQKPRRSQVSNAPTQKAIELREWDYRVFRLLHPELGYQELPSNWIVALLGGYYKDKLERLATLSQPPHSYLVRNKTKKNFFRHSTYTRSSKLDSMLEQKPEYLGGSRAHLLYSSLIVASTELGINADPHAKLLRFIDLHTIGWTANKERRRVPYTDDILKIPCDKFHFLPDWRPFRIERKSKAFFIFDEAERSEKNAKELKEKIGNWLSFFNNQVYRSRFNFGSNTLVRFTFNDEATMRRAMSYVDNSPHLIFTQWRDFNQDISFPKPTDSFYRRDYECVGHPPVNFSKLGG
jgi:hypothetical protein